MESSRIMMEPLSILGCAVPAAQVDQWRDHLVSEAAPFFLPPGIDLPAETLILSRQALGYSGLSLTHRDSYATHAVSERAGFAALITPAEFDALPAETQRALLTAQVEFGRGQVYAWEQAAPLLDEARDLALSRTVTVRDRRYVILDTRLWRSLCAETQRRWLTAYLTADNPPICQSSTLTPDQWARIDRPSIRRLAGTFPSASGPNCFSTVLAGLTRQPDTAHTIAENWLQQETFFDGLARRGHTRSEADVSSRQDAVLVWIDGAGVARHAALLLGGGLALNKHSQAWYSPWQILSVGDLLAYWQDEPLTIQIYEPRGGA